MVLVRSGVDLRVAEAIVVESKVESAGDAELFRAGGVCMSMRRLRDCVHEIMALTGVFFRVLSARLLELIF